MSKPWISSSLIFLMLSPTTTLAQWIQTSLDTVEVRTLYVNSTNVFAGTSAYGVFLSTDNGTTWAQTGLDSVPVYAFSANSVNLFAATDAGLYTTTNDGATWSQKSLPDTCKLCDFGVGGVTAVVSTATDIFVGAFGFQGFSNIGAGVLHSTDNGDNWTQTSLDSLWVQAFALNGSDLFVGTDAGVFLTTDNGQSWTAVNNGLTQTEVKSLLSSSPNIFAGTVNDQIVLGIVFVSTDNGTNWTEVTTGFTSPVNSFAVSSGAPGTNLFAGTDYSGVFLSTNNGTSWTSFNTGLTDPNPSVSSLAVGVNNLFAGTDTGVWRRPLSDITSVASLYSDFPMHFNLAWNYPNPFNPSTTISFTVPLRSYTSLKIFDALGREISSLVSEELPPGSYSRQWTGIGFPSGVYFYRLSAGHFSVTKKLILLR